MLGMLYCIAIEPLLHTMHTTLGGLSEPSCNDRFILSAYDDDVINFC